MEALFSEAEFAACVKFKNMCVFQCPPIQSNLVSVMCVFMYICICVYIYGRETFRHYFVVLLLSVSLYFILIQVYNLISSII